MRKPRIRRKRKQRQTEEEKVILSLSNKLILVLLPVTVMVFVAFMFYLSGKQRQQDGINRTVRHWQNAYNLKPEQADRLRQIEMEFHGNGNPFRQVKKPSADEIQRHHVEMSEQIEEEIRPRFLTDLRKSSRRH